MQLCKNQDNWLLHRATQMGHNFLGHPTYHTTRTMPEGGAKYHDNHLASNIDLQYSIKTRIKEPRLFLGSLNKFLIKWQLF